MVFGFRKRKGKKQLGREELRRQILSDIQPGVTEILKSDGQTRRPVTSNTGQRITMRVGVRTKAVKTITLDMVWFAYQTLKARGRFDSRDIRARFPKAYRNGPCIYSMTGGLLVELGLADLRTGRRRSYYVPA